MQFEFSNVEKLSSEVAAVVSFIPQSRNLQDIVKYIPKHLQKFDTVHISFAEDDEIQLLNRLYRNLDKPTDVLSFEIQEEKMLGELHISLSEVKKNSEYFKNDFLKELFDVIVHGILHLSEYDHSDEMFDIQHKIRDAVFNEYQNYRSTGKSGN